MRAASRGARHALIGALRVFSGSSDVAWRIHLMHHGWRKICGAVCASIQAPLARGVWRSSIMSVSGPSSWRDIVVRGGIDMLTVFARNAHQIKHLAAWRFAASRRKQQWHHQRRGSASRAPLGLFSVARCARINVAHRSIAASALRSIISIIENII